MIKRKRTPQKTSNGRQHTTLYIKQHETPPHTHTKRKRKQNDGEIRWSGRVDSFCSTSNKYMSK